MTAARSDDALRASKASDRSRADRSTLIGLTRGKSLGRFCEKRLAFSQEEDIATAEERATARLTKHEPAVEQATCPARTRGVSDGDGPMKRRLGHKRTHLCVELVHR
jgi:hypothetical protein